MEETTETTTEKPEQFTIQTREHAEWYLRKLANLDREEASIRAQAEAMVSRLRSDRESLQGRYQSQFESFVRGELERTKSKRRSVLFFNGTALLDYAKEQFEATGELLPGVGRTEASERFAIKFSEAKAEEGAEG